MTFLAGQFFAVIFHTIMGNNVNVAMSRLKSKLYIHVEKTYMRMGIVILHITITLFSHIRIYTFYI